MARMIPAVIPEDTRSRAEKKLFPILEKSLDDSYTVFHSFDLLTHNPQNKFIEGEIDYLIFSPRSGLLVLEVKGGAICYDGASSTWFQNQFPLPRSPFEQAQRTKYQLLDFLKQKLGYNPPLPLGHAVCFPDVLDRIEKLPVGADPEICLTGKDLLDMAKAIHNIMQTYQNSLPLIPDKHGAEKIRQILMPYFEYGANLASRVQQDEQIVIRLTDNQCRMLDFIRNRKQALIQGCAGSGKTIMAVKKARELAAQGNSVLLLAYNRLLGERLAESVKGVPNITANTYHDFCLRHLEEAGCEPIQENSQEYWEKTIPEAFAGYIREHSVQCDAIIIDEGQDFRMEYWLTIEELRKPGGYFYIFYDPDQNLYNTEMELPIRDEPYVLIDNCRNSRNIFNKLKKYTEREMRFMDGLPQGEKVHQYQGITDRNRRRILRSILGNLIEEQGLKPEQIVVLGGHSLGKTCLSKDSHLGNYLVSEGTETGPNIIHYHTYMKFKGCEADAVILLDVDKEDERWSDTALYTAISRAKHLLYIIRKD